MNSFMYVIDKTYALKDTEIFMYPESCHNVTFFFFQKNILSIEYILFCSDGSLEFFFFANHVQYMHDLLPATTIHPVQTKCAYLSVHHFHSS